MRRQHQHGCWGWPNAFEPTAGDQTICGTIYADNGTDSDWFEYVAMADDTMTWTVRSNFASHIGLVEQYVPGEPGCSNWTYNFNPSAVTSDCEDVSISFPVTAGGTYYLFIEPQSYSGSPCGTTNDYVATLTGSICGDLDDDGDVDYDDYVIFLAAFGGPVDGNPPQDAECDYDDSGAVGMADYAAWLACYRDFVGDPLAGPPIGGDDIPAPTIVDPSHGSSRPRPQLRSDQSRTGRGLEAIATCSGDDRPHCMPCMCGRRRPPRCSRSEDTRGIIQTNEHFRTARATASDGRSEELIGGRGQWCFRRLICAAVLTALTLALPASADMLVWLEPASPTVDVGGFVDVDLMASFDEPVVAWGLDVAIAEPTFAGMTNVALGTAWDAPGGSLDQDGLAGLRFNTGIAGEVLLATLTFQGLAEGQTLLTPGCGPEEDEGLMLESTVMVTEIQFTGATLTVIPEPATALLTVGLLALTRRR